MQPNWCSFWRSGWILNQLCKWTNLSSGLTHNVQYRYHPWSWRERANVHDAYCILQNIVAYIPLPVVPDTYWCIGYTLLYIWLYIVRDCMQLLKKVTNVFQVIWVICMHIWSVSVWLPAHCITKTAALYISVKPGQWSVGVMCHVVCQCHKNRVAGLGIHTQDGRLDLEKTCLKSNSSDMHCTNWRQLDVSSVSTFLPLWLVIFRVPNAKWQHWEKQLEFSWVLHQAPL